MSADICIKQTPEGSVFLVLAVVRSSKTEIVDIQEERCKIKVKAPPVDGEANAALCQYLSKVFGIPKTRVVLVQGQTSKRKSFLLQGLASETAAAILNEVLGKKQ